MSPPLLAPSQTAVGSLGFDERVRSTRFIATQRPSVNARLYPADGVAPRVSARRS
jgi:hypothetical protein